MMRILGNCAPRCSASSSEMQKAKTREALAFQKNALRYPTAGAVTRHDLCRITSETELAY
jgi:hypothetical protein